MNTLNAPARVRFAPSPTGDLHIGGLRTALFDYLLAKKSGGHFILRIEDTDQKRLNEASLGTILDALNWCGLSYDEGPDKPGSLGPYLQSERLPIYRQHIDQLLSGGFAYHCFCSEERIEEVRRQQAEAKLPPRYDGMCRQLSAEDSARRVAAGEKYVIRLKMPQTGTAEFVDAIRGRVTFEYALVDDQVILKSDGFPTYHLAVVVDDHLMSITHVIRGEEWISSTPKHVYLYEAFGWQAPVFVHVPLILSPTGGKLSKRDGAVSTLSYRDEGYLPEALINFVAFLGWNPKTEQEIFTLAELVDAFSLEKINKAGAVYSLERLQHVNAQHMKRLSLVELTDRCLPFYEAAGVPTNDREKLENVTALIRDRLVTLKDAPELARFIFSLPEYEGSIVIPKKGSDEATTVAALDLAEKTLSSCSDEEFRVDVLKERMMTAMADAGLSNSQVLWPSRVALSGSPTSPGVFEIAEVLGREESLRRIQIAREKLAK